MNKELTNIGKRLAQCYGCSSCDFICPNSAISFVANDHGFFYPKVEADKCINCGLCTQVCPITKENSFKNTRAERCYAVKNNDSIRSVSSSGGVYTALTDIVIRMGGACVGSIYSQDHKVVYEIADSNEKRNAQRGSKYVQSYMSPIVLSRLIEIINSERDVLISGTPCQIAAIKSLLNKKKINANRVLYIDIVCHGTPSPEVWKNYLSEIEITHNSNINKYTFRDKQKGWRGYHVSIELKNGAILEGTDETDSFVNMFNDNLTLRDSCFKCPYASMERCGDITIGDFWGIENIDPSFSDNKGISMVIANTLKGSIYLAKALQDVEFKEYSTRVVIQPNMHRPTERGIGYKRFWNIYKKKGYNGIKERFAAGGKLYLLYYYRKAIKLRLKALRKELQ